MNKSDLKHLLSIVKGGKEQDCVRYAVCKCSGLTQTQARNHLRIWRLEHLL